MTQSPEDVFTRRAPAKTIQRVAARMRERNIDVVVVDDGDQARHQSADVAQGESGTAAGRPGSETRLSVTPRATRLVPGWLVIRETRG
jgi:hypothetical protein